MKKVLWLSRHQLVDAAVAALKATLADDVEIAAENLVFSADGSKAAKQLLEAAANYDVIGGVFPAQLWVNILKDPAKFACKSMFVVVSVPKTAEDGVTRTFEFDHIEMVEL